MLTKKDYLPIFTWMNYIRWDWGSLKSQTPLTLGHRHYDKLQTQSQWGIKMRCEGSSWCSSVSLSVLKALSRWLPPHCQGRLSWGPALCIWNRTPKCSGMTEPCTHGREGIQKETNKVAFTLSSTIDVFSEWGKEGCPESSIFTCSRLHDAQRVPRLKQS